MVRCLETDIRVKLGPFECQKLYTALGFRRAMHLLPLLRSLVENAATAATEKEFTPSPERIDKLLAVLETGKGTPSLKMERPKTGTRISGRALALVIAVELGTALEARLAGEPREPVDKYSEVEVARDISARIGGKKMPTNQMNGEQTDQETLDLHEVDAGRKPNEPSKSAGAERPDALLPYCEVRAVVDGLVANKTPIKPGQTYAAMAAIPAYSPRCSEHPIASVLSAGGSAKGSWNQAHDDWELEVREIERVCTDEAFGPHRIHFDLVCCERDTPNVTTTHVAAPFKTETAPPSACEIFASTETTEYLHTANGADVLSSWGDEVEQEGGQASLFDPPPETISVALHLDSSPDAMRTVVTLPRWSSDGEIWEVRQSRIIRVSLQLFWSRYQQKFRWW